MQFTHEQFYDFYERDDIKPYLYGIFLSSPEVWVEVVSEMSSDANLRTDAAEYLRKIAYNPQEYRLERLDVVNFIKEHVFLLLSGSMMEIVKDFLYSEGVTRGYGMEELYKKSWSPDNEIFLRLSAAELSRKHQIQEYENFMMQQKILYRKTTNK